MSIYKKLTKFGSYNEIPTGIIDRAYKEEPKTFTGKLYNSIKIRLVYLALFVPLTFIDLAVNGVIAVTFALRTFFTSDQKQDDRLAQQKKYSFQFSKCLIALVATLLGLFIPKLVTLPFLPEFPEEGVTAGGNYHHAPKATIQAPESIEDLQEIIKIAAQKGKKVMPMGAGFSQGKQYLPEGDEELIVIDMSKISTVAIDPAKKQATVGAGAIWSDIKLEANKHKLALKVMQASDVFSVGGSLGTNIHGWNIADGMLSTVVKSITIINAKGELEVLTPDMPLFHNVTGGLGLYGIVVSATIGLTDNELLKERGVEIAPEKYVEHFRNAVQGDDKVRMHLYRLSIDPKNLLGSGVAVSYVKEDDSKPVKDTLTPEAAHGTRYDRLMVNLARHSGWARAKYWEMERARMLAGAEPAMSTNQIMQPPINAMFNNSVSESEWLQEFFLPEENLSGFLAELGKLLTANEVKLINASVRFVKQNDKSPLSYAHAGDRFAVVLCFNQSLQDEAIIKAKKWLRKAQEMTVKHGGSYYLPYQHVSDPEIFKQSYPQVDKAIAAKKAVDPQELFVSGFYKKYMQDTPAATNYFKELLNPEMQKKFAGFLKNVLKRLDSDKFFALLKDVMEYSDSHEEIYTELARRLPEIAPGALSDFRKVLDSLASIKEELTEQAKCLIPEGTEINGLVEIGYPGRFVGGFKKHYKVTGEVVAVYEQQSLGDYVQAGFPLPYDRFEKLDYTKPNLTGLKGNSADVITCYVGLHHFTEEELGKFLNEVKRVLRPGGHFLLVDHDITDKDTMCMAHMAHTVFNLATGVSLKEEMTEVRRFKPMSKWVEILKTHGLGYSVTGADKAMIRDGDPSRNRMVSFSKRGPMAQLGGQKPAAAVSVDTSRSIVHSSPLRTPGSEPSHEPAGQQPAQSVVV